MSNLEVKLCAENAALRKEMDEAMRFLQVELAGHNSGFKDGAWLPCECKACKFLRSYFGEAIA